ncbi:hypothetical protein DB32_005102 [Sandaracinus amylolyticus]|uniref:Uncharacterized protein n=1 Tax=Sandaracinus amylolyticus TaxID=927083 RepID=A0A0F6YJD8_9BACT|nr:hypothetical protein DB32_005102 [Sandaracinus amylolyticus]
MLALLTCLGACAPDAAVHETELVASQIDPSAGTDERPSVDVVLHGRVVARRASAAVRLGEGAAYLARDGRLVVIDGAGRERSLGDDVLAPPITDGSRLVWSDAQATIFELRDAEPVELARAPGTMAPLAILEDGSIALVGSTNGGVAGLWILDDELRCLTNCALRTGRAWGDDYVPPPSGASIHRDGEHVVFVAADGVTHRVPR